MNLDMNELQGEARKMKEDKDRTGFGGNNSYLQMPEGKGSLNLRLLPPAKAGIFGDEKGPFYQKSRLHRVNGRNFHCPREDGPDGRLIGDCEICKYLRWLWSESEKADEDEKIKMQTLYRQIKAIDRYYYNVIQRNQPQEDGSTKDSDPLIFSCGKTLHEKVINGICGDPDVPDDNGFGDITDIKVGRDFVLIKTIKPGKEKWPDYTKSHFTDKESPLSEPQQIEEWLGALHDLKSLRVVKSKEELEHNLQVHLNLKEDVDESFDNSKYSSSVQEGPVNGKSAEVDAKVTVTKTKPEKETPAPEEKTEPVAVAVDKPLPEGEFMKELQATLNKEKK